MPDLRDKIMSHFYDIWNGVGIQCESMTVRQMEKICWITRESQAIMENAYHE
tara:strand:+ start:2287 stop:2442 length:156 start_codon:yes stop_codon:yes gene_type:complete